MSHGKTCKLPRMQSADKLIDNVIERLEAWSEGSKLAQNSAEARGDSESASFHLNRGENYQALIDTLLLAKANLSIPNHLMLMGERIAKSLEQIATDLPYLMGK